jgi:hypothetical protein
MAPPRAAPGTSELAQGPGAAPLAVPGPVAPGEGLPADLGPEQPVPTPAPLQPGRSEPGSGLQFGLGLPVVDLRSEALGVHLQGGKPSQTGVLLQVEALWDPFRAGYARQLYRTELPAGTTLDGMAVDALSFDSDQFWAFHGFRPYHSLYLGYGLGLQRRQVRVLAAGLPVRTLNEATLQGGLLADWAVGPPFSLELRLFGDVRGRFLRERAAALQLAFTAAF